MNKNSEKRHSDPEETKHLKIMDLLKEQLLIVFLRRLGGKLEIKTSEIDETAGASFSYGLSKDGKAFSFEVVEKEEGK